MADVNLRQVKKSYGNLNILHGIDLDIKVLRPRQSFQRMLDNQEFELSELSLASYTVLKARGNCPYVAVPVALSKIFRHSCIYVRRGSGITKPADLRGKRVGTSQWSSTGLCFMRGFLQHDFGILAQDMHWFMGGLNTFVEPPLIPLNLPNAIKLDFLSAGQTLEKMCAAGELDDRAVSEGIPSGDIGAGGSRLGAPEIEITQAPFGNARIFQQDRPPIGIEAGDQATE